MSKKETRTNHYYPSRVYENERYFTNDGLMRLRSYLGRVEIGSDKDWRTPFFNKKDRQEILDGWSTHLEQLKSKWPSLLEFENNLRDKVGPLSIMKPWKDRLEDLDDYYKCIEGPSVPINDLAIVAVAKEFSRVRGLRLRSQQNTMNFMKKSTNSGNPYFQRKNKVIAETMPCEIVPTEDGENYDFYQVLSPKREWFDISAVVGWRGQEGGPEDSDVKQRVVWMFPFAINLKELQVYQPFIEACQSADLVPAWISQDRVDRQITNMFDTKHPKDLVICTDFTKFDQHFNHNMQMCAREILSLLLCRDDESRAWMRRVFEIKYNIPIITPSGIRFGSHGMASGSGGTNCDETLSHRALQYECAIKNKAVLNPYSQCLGDDGVLTFPGITIDKVTSVYSSHGLEMNESKQYADTETAEYLRRWYNTHYRVGGICRGVYSTYRALGRLAGQERFYDPDIWTPEMVALRQLSILENIKWHPLKEEFVQYCMKGDKFRLGIDLPGFLDNIVAYASKATEYMPDFLGYTRSLQKDVNSPSGIASWWIVRYLKSLS